MTKSREWAAYSVGEPSKKRNWTNADCTPLDTVYHVCHVKDAFRYLEDGSIKSSLVWDESRLKDTRACVSWLSPNLWVSGSLYGSIRFDFNWRELVERRKFYWVEAMTSYRPPAYRILIAKGKPSIKLEAYPVEDGDGPLWYDSANDIWYYNGRFTGEFMVDSDLSLLGCEANGFVSHHGVYCRKDGPRCDDRGQRGVDGGAKLLARLIAQRTLSNNNPLRDLFLDGGTMNRDVDYAWNEIIRSFSKVTATGEMKRSHPAAGSIVLAMLDRLAAGRSIKALGALFSSSDELELTLRNRAAGTRSERRWLPSRTNVAVMLRRTAALSCDTTRWTRPLPSASPLAADRSDTSAAPTAPAGVAAQASQESCNAWAAMPKSVNKLILLGKVGEDPEVRYS